jgi:hypothetical protein
MAYRVGPEWRKSLYLLDVTTPSRPIGGTLTERREELLKTIALMGLGAALAVPPVAAVAQTG